ncbi:MAG: hypothetical protein ABIJ18_04110 [archaeon]
MKIRDRLLELLQDSPLTTKEIQTNIPDKSNRVLAATVSNNPEVFIRLEMGLVGLKNRDEHLVTGKKIRHDKYCLYKKIANLLIERERRLEELYDALPDEKMVSIRASVTQHPELFFRIEPGVIGRRGRDEYLIEKYRRARNSTKIRRPRLVNR